MLAFANAKINIGLNIVAKRRDGYHDIETVFVPVKLFDVIELTDAPKTSCVMEGVTIPGDEKDNLCLKAYYLLAEDFELPPQKITLLKNIPVGAGLGGGSSDAASVLMLLNNKFQLNLSVAVLQGYARQLGADCAFFIENEPAFAFGKGDEFEAVPLDLSSYFRVLVKPTIHVSTADAYAAVKPQVPSSSLKELIHLPVTQWREAIRNDFEVSVGRMHPEVLKIKEALYTAGAVFALMSGSGSSVFALFEHEVVLPQLEENHQVFYNV